jgi:hypothetical protein
MPDLLNPNPLTLTLFMPGIIANHPHHPGPPHNLAALTNAFDGTPDLHTYSPLNKTAFL